MVGEGASDAAWRSPRRGIVSLAAVATPAFCTTVLAEENASDSGQINQDKAGRLRLPGIFPVGHCAPVARML
jgi:hypothetical protein